jgi:hypothetical protein
MEDVRLDKEDSMTPYAAAWRVDSKGGKLVYRLQINNISKKHKKAATEAVAGWSEGGQGWHPASKTELWLMTRSFETPYAFKKWAKQFPYELEVQKDTRGRKKKHK